MAERKEVKINLGSNSASKSYSSNSNKNDYIAGIRTEKDMLAPGYIEVVDDKTLLIDGKYIRNFVMQGYPNQMQIGWLRNLYSYRGNMDVMVKFEPMDPRAAVDRLTKEITNYLSQLSIEQEKGSIKNITKYEAKIEQLTRQRAMLEQNRTNLLQGTIYVNLMADTKDELDEQSELLMNKIKGQRMDLVPTYSRMVEGFKAALPSLPEGIKDKKRNFNSGCVVASFHLYNSELSDPNGVLLGINRTTQTPAIVNMLGDGKKITNNNLSIFGRAGSGKSFFVSLLILRSSIKGVLTAIVDPEGEYYNVASALGGVTIKIGNKTDNINMFDIDEEEEVDDDGNYTGRKVVNINEKISDLLGIIGVMAKGITPEQQSIISSVIQNLYKNFGINENPESLYTSAKFDMKTKTYYNASGVKKTMPKFSDFYEELSKVSDQYPSIKSLLIQLRMFLADGVYGMFDCYSTINLGDWRNIPVVNFDISQLDTAGGEALRPLGIYIALTYILDKFVKKVKGVQKRVVVDEAWMMLNKNMVGHEYTAKFLETLARRIRKRLASLCVASQNFSEFMSSSEGETVVKNSPYKIFLRQAEEDMELLQDVFRLSDGEAAFVQQCDIGEMLLKMDNEGSAIIDVQAYPFEKEIITRHNRMVQQKAPNS